LELEAVVWDALSTTASRLSIGADLEACVIPSA
jgi:hypothetical protein